MRCVDDGDEDVWLYMRVPVCEEQANKSLRRPPAISQGRRVAGAGAAVAVRGRRVQGEDRGGGHAEDDLRGRQEGAGHVRDRHALTAWTIGCRLVCGVTFACRVPSPTQTCDVFIVRQRIFTLTHDFHVERTRGNLSLVEKAKPFDVHAAACCAKSGVWMASGGSFFAAVLKLMLL